MIRNNDSGTAFRLKGINFVSECILFTDGDSDYIWTDALGRAKKLAEKVQQKGIVDLSRWQEITLESI